MKQIIAGNVSFIRTFFSFHRVPALTLALCLNSILFARRCPSLSGPVQTHTTTPLSDIRPWSMHFAHGGHRTKCRPVGQPAVAVRLIHESIQAGPPIIRV